MMSPNEVAGALRRVIRDDVFPDVSSDRVRGQLRQVSGLLRETDWDNLPLELLEENESLRALLGRIRPPAERGREAVRLVGVIDAALASSVSRPLRFEAVLEENRALRVALDEVLTVVLGLDPGGRPAAGSNAIIAEALAWAAGGGEN